MGLAVATAATYEPVSVQEVKNHLRVDHDEDDTVIDSLIVAARQFCETFTGRQFISTTYDETFQAWSDELPLSRPPLVSVTSVKYYDPNGVQQTLSTSIYDVITDQEPGLVRLAYAQSWPALRAQADPIVVRFVAGYGTADNVPQSIRAAMKLFVGHLYENREAVAMLSRGETLSELPLAFRSLLWQYRMVKL